MTTATRDRAAYVQAAQAARGLVAHGYNPLPIHSGEKRPALPKGWTKYRELPIPEKWLDRWWAEGAQVLTGSRWGLAVIDIDGFAGLEAWTALAMYRRLPRTWTVLSGGNDSAHFGMHLWFSVPPDQPMPSRRLWGVWDPDANKGRGGFLGKPGIELLGDGRQVIAPPSIHGRTGRAYTWADDRSPAEIEHPAPLPEWIWVLPAVKAPVRPQSRPVSLPVERPGPRGSYDFEDVLAVVRDKARVASEWGLRIASRGYNLSGWYSCHAINRPDEHPSASFHAERGIYWDSSGEVFGFFNLAVAMGAYRSASQACNSLGARFGARPSRAWAS
jgi:hypothetical protein